MLIVTLTFCQPPIWVSGEPCSPALLENCFKLGGVFIRIQGCVSMAASSAADHDLLVALVEAAANEYDLGNAVTGADGKSGELELLSLFSFLNYRARQKGSCQVV